MDLNDCQRRLLVLFIILLFIKSTHSSASSKRKVFAPIFCISLMMADISQTASLASQAIKESPELSNSPDLSRRLDSQDPAEETRRLRLELAKDLNRLDHLLERPTSDVKTIVTINDLIKSISALLVALPYVSRADQNLSILSLAKLNGLIPAPLILHTKVSVPGKPITAGATSALKRLLQEEAWIKKLVQLDLDLLKETPELFAASSQLVLSEQRLLWILDSNARSHYSESTQLNAIEGLKAYNGPWLQTAGWINQIYMAKTIETLNRPYVDGVISNWQNFYFKTTLFDDARTRLRQVARSQLYSKKVKASAKKAFAEFKEEIKFGPFNSPAELETALQDWVFKDEGQE